MPVTEQEKPELKTLGRKLFRFDGVTSLMISTLLLLLIVMLWLGAAWLSMRAWDVSAEPVKVDLAPIGRPKDAGEEGMSGDDPTLGDTQSLAPSDQPVVDQAPSPDEPPASEQSRSLLAAIEEQPPDFAPLSEQSGTSAGTRAGGAGGTGKKGFGSGGGGGLPPAQRWVIEYSRSQTLDAYARTLDAFGIELGVVRQGERVTLVSGISRARPTVQAASPEENRLYFLWQDVGRRQADRELLGRAGVSADNAQVAHYYPAGLEARLAALELAFGNKKPEQIRMTRFGVRPAGASFEFYVIQQTLF